MMVLVKCERKKLRSKRGDLEEAGARTEVTDDLRPGVVDLAGVVAIGPAEGAGET
jgi:hypothetical protein